MRPVNVTICSPFRDAADTVEEYIGRIWRLKYPADALRFIAVEGDSMDDTWGKLLEWRTYDDRLTLIKCDTGKPRYGSVVNAERFQALAKVFNAALDAVDLDWTDYVLFLPSDIVYSPDLLSRLLAHGAHIVAPFSWTEYGRFFDTWGFTRHGEEFPRFSQAYARDAFGDQPIPMDTVGGTVLIRADVLEAGCRYTPQEVDRGFCKMARAKGFLVWADPTTHVYHPPFDAGLLEPDRFDEFARAQDASTVRKAIQDKYGFDCGPEYAGDFVRFVEGLTRGQ